MAYVRATTMNGYGPMHVHSWRSLPVGRCHCGNTAQPGREQCAECIRASLKKAAEPPKKGKDVTPEGSLMRRCYDAMLRHTDGLTKYQLAERLGEEVRLIEYALRRLQAVEMVSLTGQTRMPNKAYARPCQVWTAFK